MKADGALLEIPGIHHAVYGICGIDRARMSFVHLERVERFESTAARFEILAPTSAAAFVISASRGLSLRAEMATKRRARLRARSRASSESLITKRQPLYRRAGSRVFAAAMHVATGLWEIQDTQCGFKFFRGDVARDLFGRQTVDGYMFDVEILTLALKRRYRIKQVGIRWADDGDSRLELLSGNWRNMKDLLKISWKNLVT